jgi:septal ring factor EnvC (AmiA/AmiB activator)
MGDETTQEGQDYPHRRRASDAGIPEWAKLAATVAVATVSVILWANANFISRAEMNQHLDQQSKDFARVSSSQEHYADAERGTAENLSEINSRLTRIETMLEARVPNGRPKP